MPRYAARTDENQKEIVESLREIPGVSVVTGKDDILVGHTGKAYSDGKPRTYWYEIKSKRVVSRKTGKVMDSGIKESQKRLLDTWKGHYKIVSTLDEILEDMGIIKNN